jgi:hypothetical protein
MHTSIPVVAWLRTSARPEISCAQLGKLTERSRTAQWANLQTSDLMIAY